ncbi:MAG TPA: hypothetical protein VNB24_03095 [Acidimicrobiales bacterium]|nr:hypothetical protein [Acidimicrobiales bacterium]
MGRLNKKQAGLAALAVVGIVAGALVTTTGGSDNPSSVEAIAGPRRGVDPGVIDVGPADVVNGDPASPRVDARRPSTAGAPKALTPGPSAPAGPRPDPALVPDGYRIGYRYTDPDSPSSVVVSRFDFTDERTLFTAPPGANYTAAEWSPTRDRVLIGYCIGQSPCSIRTVTLDGVASSVLDTGRQPTWSPDGRWILETKPDGDRNELWVVPSTGGTPIQVGNVGSGACCGADARWSPDSSRIAYTDPDRGGVRVVNRDGSGTQNLRDPKDLLNTVSGYTFAWSPSGDRLMVERLVRKSGDEPATARPLLAVIDLKSTRWHELGEWHGLEWAPTGDALIVQRPKAVATDRSCGSPREIGALALEDGTLRSFGDGCSAKLSPDRRFVAVADLTRAKVFELADPGANPRTVYESDGGFRSRGNQLLCCSWTPGSDALVLTDAEVVVVRIDGRARWEYRRG